MSKQELGLVVLEALTPRDRSGDEMTRRNPLYCQAMFVEEYQEWLAEGVKGAREFFAESSRATKEAYDRRRGWKLGR